MQLLQCYLRIMVKIMGFNVIYNFQWMNPNVMHTLHMMVHSVMYILRSKNFQETDFHIPSHESHPPNGMHTYRKETGRK